MRFAFIIAVTAAALTMAAPAQAGLFGWFGGSGGGKSSSSGSSGTPSSTSGGGGAMDVPAPPALMLFGMAVAGLMLGRRRS